LQGLSITIEALAVIANLGEQAWGELWSRSRQRAKQIMIWMTGKELFDSLTVHSQLFINRKEHLHQTQS
jgi:predicted component of type VI protein secretion system